MSACKAILGVIKWCILIALFQSVGAIRCRGILLPGAKECPKTMVTTTAHNTNTTPGQSHSSTTPRLSAPSAGGPVNGNSSDATRDVTSAPEYSPKGLAERFVGGLTEKDERSVLIQVLPSGLGVVVTVIVFAMIAIAIYFKQQRTRRNADEEETIVV